MNDPVAFSDSSRYELLTKIASGGMATVYVGRARDTLGLVAIKRAHPHLLEDVAFARALAAEARVASMIQHPNVCSVREVEEHEGEILLVMDYVEGSSLAGLANAATAQKVPMPAGVAIRIVLDACAGLHAAHEQKNSSGVPLGLVHRDVSPHNILVGIDGSARLADFGIARVTVGSMTISGPQTTTGILKGKVGYMSPEYVETSKIDLRADIFALGVVAWEALAQKRLFKGQSDIETLKLVMDAVVPTISSQVPALGTGFDAVFAQALAKAPDARFQTARAFGTALETAARSANLLATPAEVGAFVKTLAGPALEKRRAVIRTKAPDAEPAVQSVTSPVATEATATIVTPPIGIGSVTPVEPTPIVHKTLTLPVMTPPAQTPRPAPLIVPPDPVEPSSVAAGTAAVTVDTSDELRALPPRRKFVPLVVGIVVVMAGVTSVGLFMNTKGPSAGAPATPSASTVEPATKPAPSSIPVDVPTASASAAKPIPPPADSTPKKPPHPAAGPRPHPNALDTAAPNPYAK